MDSQRSFRLPLWRRLSFRVAVVVTIGFVLSDASHVLYWWAWERLGMPDLNFPEYSPAVDPGVEFIYWWGWTSVVAVALGMMLGWIVSRLMLRRLSEIAGEAGMAFESTGDLPGPFDESGHDEISVLSRTLNSMRRRTLQLVERIERRDTERSEWVAQVSHDLRTPLTALMACLDHAAQCLDEGALDAEALGQVLVAARTDARRLESMTEDLLDIALLEVAELVQFETVLPAELADRAQLGLSPLAEERGIQLEVELGPNLPTIQADGRLLARALENLLLNSIQHARSRVCLSLSASGTSLGFRVVDDGPGFPGAAAGARLGDLRRYRSRADSIGIGLLVVERVVRAHGGTAIVRDLPEGGAEVRLDIPVRSEGEREPEDLDPSPSGLGRALPAS